MTPDSFDAIARRFDFDRWLGANALGRGLFVRNYRIPPPAPGWELVRQWAVPAVEDMPPALQTLWRNPASGPDALLRIDVYECPSREAAHRHMLRLLGEHQVEGPDAVEQGTVGDVHAVAGEGNTAVFARGNLVVFVARAGTQPAAARAIASSLDADITFEPPAELGQTLAPQETAFGAEGPEALRTAIDTGGADEPRATVKIFSDGAEIIEESGRLELRVTDPARANAVVYTLPAEGGPSRASAMEEQENA